MDSTTDTMDVARVYKITEVARVLKVDVRTVRKLIDEDIIKKDFHYFYVGHQIRIKQCALDLIMGD